MANAVIDIVINNELDMLEPTHMELLLFSLSDPDFGPASQVDQWFKLFQKLKDYLLVSICHPELCPDALVILHNYFTVDVLRHLVYDEAREVYLKSLELLFQGQSDECKETFKTYLNDKVV